MYALDFEKGVGHQEKRQLTPARVGQRLRRSAQRGLVEYAIVVKKSRDPTAAAEKFRCAFPIPWIGHRSKSEISSNTCQVIGEERM